MDITGLRFVDIDENGNPSYKENIVPKIDYEVAINSSPAKSICYNSTFTSVRFNYKEEAGKPPMQKVKIEDVIIKEVWGVREQYDILDLCEKVNKEPKKEKSQSTAILKGNYAGGIKGEHCKQGANYLFFDIDIKANSQNEGHNSHLYSDDVARLKLLEALEKHAVFVWRSSSGLGIAGVLYVPRLAGVKNTRQHLAIGDAVTTYLEELILNDCGINVTFDSAQNKFRQIRFLAHQKETVEINREPTAFNFIINEHESYSNGSRNYSYNQFTPDKGSIREQFNKNNPIRKVLTNSGFSIFSGDRYKHPLTTSTSTGVVVGETFFNHSESFSNIPVFDSFALAAFANQLTQNEFSEYLKSQGYKTMDIDLNALKQLAESTTEEKTIWEIAQKVKSLSQVEKREWLDSLKISSIVKQHFTNYLNLKQLVIPFYHSLRIKKFVSERITEIFDFADKERKIVLCADTGSGKSTAVIEGFERLRPEKRMLFVAPLTVIVDQFRESGYPCLTGSDNESEHKKALSSNVVIATQEQAILHLEHSEFDYIILDEIHSMISANSYKDEVISKLSSYFKNEVLIGLTGTPNPFLPDLGFKLLEIQGSKEGTTVIQRKDNRHPEKIILQHQKSVSGRAIYRVNSKKAIETVVNELIANGHKANQIAVFESSLDVKLGEHYKGLVVNRKFGKEVKVVLTTAILDEGLSIYDNDFTDVVFIENEFRPRPEPIKQFLNRFRKLDVNRKNYHYLKVADEDNSKGFFNSSRMDFDRLSKEKGKSTLGALGSDDQFFSEDDSINEYFLAYTVSDRFYKSLNREEFNEFLCKNYNLTIESDWEYQISNIDIKTQREDKNDKIYELITNHLLEVESVVKVHTLDKKLKAKLEGSFRGENEEYIKANLNRFETIMRWVSEIRDLEFEPFDIIIADGKIGNPNIVKPKIELLKMQMTLTYPRNKKDEKISKNYRKFIEELMKLDECNRKLNLHSFR